MENETPEVQPEDKVEPEPVETTEETPEEAPEVKELKETLAEKDEQIKNLGIKARKAKKESKETDSEEPITKKSDDLDYGQLAYLQSKGIEDSEHDFIQSELEGSGMELKELLSNDYFQAKLKTHREVASVKEATPSNTRAGGEVPSSKPEFWIAKDEFPPNTPENTQLRRDIVNKKMELAKKTGMFTTQPIIEGGSES